MKSYEEHRRCEETECCIKFGRWLLIALMEYPGLSMREYYRRWRNETAKTY